MNQKHPHKVANVGKDAKKLEPLYTDDGNVKMVQPPWKAVWRFLQKLKIKLSYGSSISLLGIYLKTKKKNLQFENVYVPRCLLQHYLQ